MISRGNLVWDSDVRSRAGEICCVEFKKDIAAVGTSVGAILFYRLLDGRNAILERTVAPPSSERLLKVKVVCLKFSPCFRYIAGGLVNGIVVVFDINNFENLQLINRHQDHKGNPITSLCWAVDSCKLFSGCCGGRLIELNLAENPGLDIFSSVVSLFGISSTTFIGECGVEIRSIDTTFSFCSESSGDVGDVILVSCVGNRVLHFKLPRHGSKQARMLDLAAYVHKYAFGSTADVACGCFLPLAPVLLPLPGQARSGSPFKKNAPKYSILLISNSNRLLICHTGSTEINDVVLRPASDTFLSVPIKYVAPVVSIAGGTLVLIAITTTAKLALIDLNSNVIEILDRFDDVSSVAISMHTILVMHGQGRKQVDMLRLIHPSSIALPVKIFGYYFSLAIRRLQQKWRRHKAAVAMDALEDLDSESEAYSSVAPSPMRTEYEMQRTITNLESSIHMFLLETDTDLEHVHLNLHAPSLNVDHVGMSESINSNSGLQQLSGRSLSGGSAVHDDDSQGWGSSSEYCAHADSIVKLNSVCGQFEVQEVSRCQFFVDLIGMVDASSQLAKDLASGGDGSNLQLVRKKLRTVLSSEALVQDSFLVGSGDEESKSREDEVVRLLLNEVDTCLSITAVLFNTLERSCYDESSKLIQPNRLSVDGHGEGGLSPHAWLINRGQAFVDNSRGRGRSLEDWLGDAEALTQQSAKIIAEFDEKHEPFVSESHVGSSPWRKRCASFGVENVCTPARMAPRPFGSDTNLVIAGEIMTGPERGRCVTQAKDRLPNQIVGVELGSNIFDPFSSSDTDLDGEVSHCNLDICSPVSCREEQESGWKQLKSESSTDNDTQSPDLEPEPDPEWLRNTSDVWLDRWNESNEKSGDMSAIRERIKHRRSRRLCWTSTSSATKYNEGESTQEIVNRQDKRIAKIDLVDTADELAALQRTVGRRGALDRATYEVTLPVGPRGAGINFCMDRGNVLTVHGFSVFPVGCPNYAKQSGLISIGDILVAVNGTYISKLSRDESFEILRSFAACSKDINVILRFRYCDAPHEIIKRPRIVVGAEVWRDVGDSVQSRHNFLTRDEDEGGDSGGSDHNPLFDIFPAEITTSALQSFQRESKRVNDLSMLDIASALWSGSIDEYAWASDENQQGRRRLLSGSELMEKDLQTRHMYPHIAVAVSHCISSPSDIHKSLPVIAEQIWRLYGHMMWRNNAHRPDLIKRWNEDNTSVSEEMCVSRRWVLGITSDTVKSARLTEFLKTCISETTQSNTTHGWISKSTLLVEYDSDEEEPLTSPRQTSVTERFVRAVDLQEEAVQLVATIRSMDKTNRSRVQPPVQHTVKSPPSGRSVRFTSQSPPASPGRASKDYDVMIAPFVPEMQITWSVYDLVKRVMCEGGVLGCLKGIDTLVKVWLATFPPLLPPSAANRHMFHRLQRSQKGGDVGEDKHRLSESSEHRARVSSLVTFFFLIHTVLPNLRKTSCPTPADDSTVLVGESRQRYTFPAVLREFCIDMSGSGDVSGAIGVDQWDVREVDIFFDSYGNYVDLDIFAAGCCIRKFAAPLCKCLDMASKLPDVLDSYNPFTKKGSSYGIGIGIEINPTSSLLFEGYVIENKLPGTLCILLAYMHHIFTVCPAQAISLCASFYPLIQPWNVICILGIVRSDEEMASTCEYADRAGFNQRLTHYWDCVSLTESPAACSTEDEAILLCSYLLRIASRKAFCEDVSIVHTLVETSLQVHSATTALIGSEMTMAHSSSDPVMYCTHFADLSAISSLLLEVLPWQHNQGNELLAIVRNIILRPESYSYDSAHVADMCLQHGFVEGALEVVRLSMQRCGGVTVPERIEVPSLHPLLLDMSSDHEEDGGAELWDIVGSMDSAWCEGVVSEVMQELCRVVLPMTGSRRRIDELMDNYVGDMFCKAFRMKWLLLYEQECILGDDLNGASAMQVADKFATFLNETASTPPQDFVTGCLTRALGSSITDLIVPLRSGKCTMDK